MDLRGALLRAAATRPHVLVLELPGGTGARVAVETETRRRGWPAAVTPADADLVVVAGPAAERFTEPVERIWRQVPRPRAFVRVHGHEIGDLLDAGSAALRSGGHETSGVMADDAAWRGARGDSGTGTAGSDSSDRADPAQGSVHLSSEDEGGERSQEQEHGAHHGHGGGSAPGGLAMADRGPDRDGLALDQLHVPLGPLLPCWPAGLVVHTTLQGDVIQQVGVDVPDGVEAGEDFWRWPWRRADPGEEVTSGHVARARLAELLDALGRLLAVAGWGDAAGRAGALRDSALGGAGTTWVRRRLFRLTGRVRRSRTLWWLIGGIGERRSSGGGDVGARCSAWLNEMERVVADLDSTEPASPDRGDERRGAVSLPEVLPELLEGVEFASARLIVASLGPGRAPDGAVTPGGLDG